MSHATKIITYKGHEIKISPAIASGYKGKGYYDWAANLKFKKGYSSRIFSGSPIKNRRMAIKNAKTAINRELKPKRRMWVNPFG